MGAAVGEGPTGGAAGPPPVAPSASAAATPLFAADLLVSALYDSRQGGAAGLYDSHPSPPEANDGAWGAAAAGAQPPLPPPATAGGVGGGAPGRRPPLWAIDEPLPPPPPMPAALQSPVASLCTT